MVSAWWLKKPDRSRLLPADRLVERHVFGRLFFPGEIGCHAIVPDVL